MKTYADVVRDVAAVYGIEVPPDRACIIGIAADAVLRPKRSAHAPLEAVESRLHEIFRELGYAPKAR